MYKIERRNQTIDLHVCKPYLQRTVLIQKTNQLHGLPTWMSIFSPYIFSPFVESSFFRLPNLRFMQKVETEAKHLVKSSISPFSFNSNVYFMYQLNTPYLTTHLPRGDQPNPRNYVCRCKRHDTNSHTIRYRRLLNFISN